MESDKKSRQHLDAKDAMAAVLGGCNGISEKHARRRVDWVMTAGTEKQQKLLQAAIDHLQKTAPPGFGEASPDVQRQVLRMLGRMMARKYRRVGKKPPCDDPIARSRMLRIAGIVFTKKKVDRVFVPLVSDYITELDEARTEGRIKVLSVKIAWWYRFGKACGLDVAFVWIDLAGKIVKLL